MPYKDPRAKREREQKKYEARALLGLCRKCGEREPDEGKAYCAICSEKDNARSRKAEAPKPVPIGEVVASSQQGMNIAGKRNGKLVALYPVESPRNKKLGVCWFCRCDCGGGCVVRAGKFLATKSCGCICGRPSAVEEGSLKRIDLSQTGRQIVYSSDLLSGEKFGELTVLFRCEGPKNSKAHNHWYQCRCSCGTEKPVRYCHLKDGLVRSCGCLAETRLTLGGVTLGAAEWARKLGLNRRTILHRKAAGWTDEETLTRPSMRRHRERSEPQ